MDIATAGAGPFAGRLLADETLLWRGRPRQGLMLNQRDALLIPFSLLWGGFAIFWESSVLRIASAPAFMVVFGGVFVLIGLFLIAGRFFADAWIRAGLSYALTDRRILILRSRPSTSFQTVNLDRLPEATVNETSAGRGTIRFGAPASLWNGRAMGGAGLWVASLDPTPQLLAIDDVKSVFAMIAERAQGAARRR